MCNRFYHWLPLTLSWNPVLHTWNKRWQGILKPSVHRLCLWGQWQFMFPHFNPHEAVLMRGWGGSCNTENQSCVLGSCRILSLRLQSCSIKYSFFISVIILCANQGFVKNGDLFLSVMFMFLEFCIFPCFPVSGYKAKCQILPLRGEVLQQFLQSWWRQCLEFSEAACSEVLLTKRSRLHRLDLFWCSWPWIKKGWWFFSCRYCVCFGHWWSPTYRSITLSWV